LSNDWTKWNYPTSVRFGVGVIVQLGDALAELGVKRPLLITDAFLATLPMVQDILTALTVEGFEPGLFGEATPNPSGEDVSKANEAIRAGNHDGVIAFGGGSAIDVAKAAALVAYQGRPLWDFEDVGDNYLRVDTAKMLPVVAVPTTSGTGSEVGRASVIIERATHTKRIIFHPNMLPARVVADPSLTVGLPPALTAAVGMDALSHNLEALCAPGYHPMADGIATEAISLVHGSLLRAFQDGNDIEARRDMMAASLMGATAFQKGLGAMHAMAHPIGAVHGAPHGLTNAILMPYVLAYNRTAIDDKMCRLGRVLGLATPGFDGVQSWVLSLRKQLGIPHTLSSLGLERIDLVKLVPLALADAAAGGNPVVLTPDGVMKMLESAWSGNLGQ
jgi:alcohol dehydrogenase class IV